MQPTSYLKLTPLPAQLHHLHSPYLQGSKSGTYPSGALQAYHHLPTPRMSREPPEKSGVTSCIGWMQLYLLEGQNISGSNLPFRLVLPGNLKCFQRKASVCCPILIHSRHSLFTKILQRATLPALTLCQCRPLPPSCEGKCREEEEESSLLNPRN